MKKWLPVMILLLFLGLYLRQYFFTAPATESDQKEKCLVCHQNFPDISAAHPIEAFGCVRCHLGNGHSLDENEAHRGMVKNPGQLGTAEKTCGQTGCHPSQVRDVKHGLMATNRGIFSVLLYQWGETNSPDDTVTVEQLRRIESGGSLAVEHFRKFCATCHLWKDLGDLPGEIGTRGGGCSDCHSSAQKKHSAMTTQIEMHQCVKCHNRSARTGLSYQGIFESEWYGTPYRQGGLSADTLSGDRYFYRLLPDIHFEAGMVCIDCHTSKGVMGDGQSYAHFEQQNAVQCEHCHLPQFATPDSLTQKLAQSNPNLPLQPGEKVAMASHGAQLVNMRKKKGNNILIKKLGGDTLHISTMSQKAYHNMPGHERLSCQSCHSAWTPQCYGCHEIYQKGEKQLDKLSMRETDGRWSESRSYLRFEKPLLGIGIDGKQVEPFAPGCQVFLTSFAAGGTVDTTFTALAMSGFDPHTTRKQTPSCEDCHRNPKMLGLGEGVLFRQADSLKMQYTYDSRRSDLGIDFPLEAFVSPNGQPLQTTNRNGARPFNQKEIIRILRVNACLPCHDRYDDPIYRDFGKSRMRFKKEKQIICRRRLEEN